MGVYSYLNVNLHQKVNCSIQIGQNFIVSRLLCGGRIKTELKIYLDFENFTDVI